MNTTISCRRLPHYLAAMHSTLRGFQLVFEAGIQYFPKKMGITFLFRTSDDGLTPLKRACIKHGREEVLKTIENALVGSSNSLYNTEEALMLAATDEDICLDGVYFLLRREPDVLARLLSAARICADGNSGGIANNGTSDKEYCKRK